MRMYVLAVACCLAAELSAQASESDRLSYQFVRPTIDAVTLATQQLPTLNGEFLSIVKVKGDSIAMIMGRVKTASWRANRELKGRTMAGGDNLVSYGLIQQYLRGDRRFRVLVIPAYCAGCAGNRRVFFLPYSDTTGFIVGSGRAPR